MDRIHIQAAMVIELFDQFTGRQITEGQAYITAMPEQKTIRKGNGCYVFLYPFVPKQVITVHSQIYEECQVEIMQSAKDTFTHQILWLVPNSRYQYPAGTTCIQGKINGCRPGEDVRIYLEKENRMVRLAMEYERNSNRIALYGCMDEMRNTEYAVCSQGQCNIIHLLDKGNSEEYILQEAMEADYKKSETLLHRIYHAVCRSDGSFFLALPDVPCNTTAHILAGDTWETMPIVLERQDC